MALGCVSCDIPVTRKVCGFLGHNSRLGCNKCYKQFIVVLLIIQDLIEIHGVENS